MKFVLFLYSCCFITLFNIVNYFFTGTPLFMNMHIKYALTILLVFGVGSESNAQQWFEKHIYMHVSKASSSKLHVANTEEDIRKYSGSFPFRNVSLSWNERVNDLVSYNFVNIVYLCMVVLNIQSTSSYPCID